MGREKAEAALRAAEQRVSDLSKTLDQERATRDAAVDKAVAAATDMGSARVVFRAAGFRAPSLGEALAVAYLESGGFVDAVGDLDRMDKVWGPSVGLFQVRTLRNPLGFGEADRWRFAWALRHPLYAAVAAYHISDGGKDWSKWSVWRDRANNGFADRVGKDYRLRTGHRNADRWAA
jgi:hypothetical protein